MKRGFCTWSNGELTINKYQIYRLDETSSACSTRGDGVGVYVANTIFNRHVVFLDTVNDAVEPLCLEIKQHQSGPKILFITCSVSTT